MEGLKLIPYLALVICIAGIILGAGSVVLGNFGDSLSNKCWNTSYSYDSTNDSCTGVTGTANAVSSPGRNFSTEFWVVWNAQEGESDVGEQLPTLAIIGVMVVIISVIAGVFVYMRYFG